MRFRELDPSGRLSTGYIASIIPGALLACVAAALVSAPLASLRADDIAPDQIEQLQKAQRDARATRDALAKSLKQAEERSQKLSAMIARLKGDLDATRKALSIADKELASHPEAVRKFEEERSKALVKAANEAKASREQAAATSKSVQDKVRAARDVVLGLKSQKTKAESRVAAAQKDLKARQDAIAKAKKDADAAKVAADVAAKKAAQAAQAAEKAIADAKAAETTIASARAEAAKAATQIDGAEKSLTAANGDAVKSQQMLAAATAQAVARQMAAEKSLIALGRLESFAQKVAPILSRRCLACHDAKTAKGRFSVETFSALLRGGESGPELVAGKSDKSNLVTLIEDGSMPQDADPLTKAEIATIRKWIDTGATLDAGLSPGDPLIALMPSMPQPAAPTKYRVPLPVTALAFNPDGDQLASSGYHEVLVWNADGTLLRRISNVAERVYALQYSPDGTLIAVAAGTPAQLGEVKLFNAATGDLVADLARSGDAIFAVAFSPDGKRVAAGGADRAIKVFDVATRKQQLNIEDHADWVMDLAWLPDGSKLVSASRDKTAKVFDAKTGDSLVTFNGHGEPVYGVAIAPDGKTAITSGRDKSLRRWNLADGKETQKIAGFGDEVLRVAVTKDGRIFSGCADRAARLHNLTGGGLVKSFAGHKDGVYAIAFCPTTGRFASGAFDGEIRLWDVKEGKGLVSFLAGPGYKRPPTVATARQIAKKKVDDKTLGPRATASRTTVARPAKTK